ncbi:hypothetical protein D3C87_1745670 [compost metagenome]
MLFQAPRTGRAAPLVAPFAVITWVGPTLSCRIRRDRTVPPPLMSMFSVLAAKAVSAAIQAADANSSALAVRARRLLANRD